MIVRALALATTLLALVACASMEQQQQDRTAADGPPGQVAGEAVSCIDIRAIRDTRVYGDQTIDFEMNDGTIYRNALPNRCFSLGFEERFGYETSTGRLCNVDTITVLRPDGSHGSSCGLGEFVLVELGESTGG